MQNTYLRALEGALKDGCFIKVFLCGARYPVTRVEKRIPGKNGNDLVSYHESAGTIQGLFGAAEKFMDEDDAVTETDKEFTCHGIEQVVTLRGYTLHAMMLPTGKFLAFIGSGCCPNYIPVKAAIGDTLQESLELLDAMLMKFDFNTPANTHAFFQFVGEQCEPVYEYYDRKKQKEE